MVQFWNISTDDIRSYPVESHRSYAPVVGASMGPDLLPFVKQNDKVVHVILAALEPFLGLPAGTLLGLHEKPESLCESEVRIIYKKAPVNGAFKSPVDANGKALPAIGCVSPDFC